MGKKLSGAGFHSVLLVGPPSESLERRCALLHESGFDITLAEDVCKAEIFAERQYFDAAIYDEALRAEEQVSLARIMRVRWPWMRLIRCAQQPMGSDQAQLFDASEASEALLPDTLRRVLS